MRISLGTTVDAAWTKFIAVNHSTTGGNWTPLNARDLSVMGRAIEPVVSPVNYNPLREKGRYRIDLVDNSGHKVLSFTLDQITNQAGWTINQAGLNQAIDDLTTWISASI